MYSKRLNPNDNDNDCLAPLTTP